MLQISSLQRVRVRVGSHARSVQRRLWSQPLDRLAFIFAIMAAMVCVTAVEGGEVKGLSFYPPFKTFSAKGDRTVPSWTLLGGTQVKQSFARLTPDLPSNAGAMYTRLTGRFITGSSNQGQFSLVMSFRMSGKHEKSHGKHLALVIGNPELIRRQGPTFGLAENFVGVGVAITSRPPADLAEPQADPSDGRGVGPRQYVSFFANNGTRTTEEVRVLANSCASTLRYLENRDDFNFLKTSRIRMGYEDGEVTLEIDARNSGIWRRCISTKVSDMPEKWLDRAGVTITGSTGREVSNNHDVMSLEVYTNRDEAFDKNFVDGSKFDDDEEASEDAKKAERSKRLAAIHAHMEHEFDSVERLLKDSLSKLSYKHDTVYSRLKKLEKEINYEAFSFLNARVQGIEERVKSNAVPALENRLQGVEEEFHQEMGSSMENMMGKSKGWQLPFFLVLVLLVGIVVVANIQYRRIMKSNFYGYGGMR